MHSTLFILSMLVMLSMTPCLNTHPVDDFDNAFDDSSSSSHTKDVSKAVKAASLGEVSSEVGLDEVIFRRK